MWLQPGLDLLLVAGRIGSRGKGGLGQVVNGYVVRMPVPAALVKGYHHVRSLAPDMGHNLAHRLAKVSLGQGAWILVLR